MSTITQSDNLNMVIGEFQTVFKNKGIESPSHCRPKRFSTVRSVLSLWTSRKSS